MPKKNSDLIFFLAAASFYALLIFFVPHAFSKLPSILSEKVKVLIPAGVSAQRAAAILEEAGVVENAQALARAMSDIGIDRALKPGIYSLFRSTPKNVARQMAKAKPEVFKFTLIPGVSYREIAALFGKYKDGRELFEKAMTDKGNFHASVRDYLTEDPHARTIFLMPDTYFVAPGENMAADFVKMSSKLWYDRIGSKLPEDPSKKTIADTGILASLVEGEAKADDERPVLAGIFLRRLRKKMRLQSCATVIYAWEERGIKKKNLSYDDLKIDSPYNTYRNKGLPPSPICVPSDKSWLAALHPAKNDYLFFFAGKDGRHVFSKSYSEHLKKQKEAGL
ncbi:MAG: endolytic transglycosylase MltG [Synergistes sp.]|nr:endolytic transglycosylase MltG [Synergistes sp.]